MSGHPTWYLLAITARSWSLLVLLRVGKRHGAAESVILGFEPAVKLVQQWKLKASPTTGLARSPANWRSLFNECLQSLKLCQHGFRPYSLRRGGATFWFTKHQSFDRILVQGRWHTQKSARIYLNEGLSVLASMRIPPTHPDILPFLNVFNQTVRRPQFGTLEPPLNRGRTGGGMERRVERAHRSVRKALCLPFILSLFSICYCVLWHVGD